MSRGLAKKYTKEHKEQKNNTTSAWRAASGTQAVLIIYVYLERMVQCRRAYNMRVEVGEGGKSDMNKGIAYPFSDCQQREN